MPQGKKRMDAAEAQAAQDKAIAKWRKTGDGHGQNYEPWLTVRRVPSHGRVSRVLGRVTGRVHHLMSDLETNTFYVLDASDNVLDIREQYPLLPLEETLEIAEANTLKHPKHPRWKGPIIMTTDFLVTRGGDLGDYQEAWSVKPSSVLSNKRALEKLEIERLFWQARSTPWYLITERELPKGLLHNLRWLAAARDLSDFHVPADRLEGVLDELYLTITVSDEPLASLCSQMDGRLGLRAGTSLTAVRHALATKRWHVDLTKAIDPDRPSLGLTRIDG